MKKIIYISTCLLISIAIGFTNCSSDFLDRPPLGGMDKDAFLKTEDAGYKLLIACYVPMTNGWYYQIMKHDIGDQLADDATKGGSDAGDRAQVTDVVKGRPLTTNKLLGELWTHRYGSAISPCNVFLDAVTEDTELIQAGGALVSIDTKKRWIAEAHFLRAFYYFDLAMMYKNVPIIDKPLEAVDKTSIVKEDGEKVLAFILEDMSIAINSGNLPSAKTLPAGEFSRLTQEAALSIRARVHLWMNNYEEAKKDLKLVVESGAHDLIDDYQLLFNDVEKGHKSKEAVFITLFNYIPGVVEPCFIPQMNIGRNASGGWGGECLTKNLANEYEKGDPRLTHTIISSGDVMLTEEDGSGTETHDYTGYDNFSLQHNRKHYANYTLRAGGQGNLQRTVLSTYHMRYADVLLMYAESLIETNDNKSLAVELINKVRKRAFVTTSLTDSYAKSRKLNISESDRVTEAIFESKYKVKETDDLRAAVRHERRVEMGGEGYRFFDLMRWGTYISTMKEYAKTPEGEFTQAGQTLTESTWPYPIPQAEIDDVGGALTQNDNY